MNRCTNDALFSVSAGDQKVNVCPGHLVKMAEHVTSKHEGMLVRSAGESRCQLKANPVGFGSARQHDDR